MMYVCVTGSIHIEVPLKPLWPNDPTGNSSPRLVEKGESMSHPNPRSTVEFAGCCGVVIVCRGRNARLPVRWRIEAGRLHFQRVEDVACRVYVQRHARDARHQLAEHNVIDVTVDESRAGRDLRLNVVGELERLCVAA